MNHKHNILVSTLLMSFAHGVFAANNTADLIVTGKITPRACSVFFPKGGTVDLGEIKADDLKEKMNLIQSTMPHNLHISCDAAAAIAVSVKDQKMDTVHSGITHLERNEVFGLGAVNKQNIGGYKMAILPITTANSLLISQEKNQWSVAPYGEGQKLTLVDQQKFYSLSDKNNNSPSRYKLHEYLLLLNVYVAGDLDLSDEVILDGQATFEIHYI